VRVLFRDWTCQYQQHTHTSATTALIEKFPWLLPCQKHCSKTIHFYLWQFSRPRLNSVPENFGKLRDLKSLRIGWCQELDTLPRGLTRLTSLEILEIIECPSLASLPKEILEGMSSLRSLSVENCHSLTLPQPLSAHLLCIVHIWLLCVMACNISLHLKVWPP
jgi:hypothetical protein